MVVVATEWAGGFMALTFMSNEYGDLFANNCNTTSSHPAGFKECYWTNPWKLPLYIEETCYKGLTVEEKAIARSNGKGMVKDGIWKTFVRREPYGNRYKFNPDAVIPYPDICENVVCDDICVGGDLWSRGCVPEGENAGECAIDQLIEADSTDCGFVPPPPPAEGRINSIDVPAEASEGDSIDLCATIENVGESSGLFFLRFYDGATMVRETLPGWVDSDETIEDICELFTMPDHAWSGKIELVRQE